ncbi:GNAT family N-acetyltransferase [Saccharospirillum salsuginis]|uniref:N-acetyltransferase YsnE n=1 Tax=Saccharospirillum salsuginis TaxID=418750 RepID=A0A918KRW2_9GAMM|nr:GNAT family N-acetyltransferase [Saccharospirillum salsuginis]GGX73618.1 putative N-acetyltransferase YsnE [Saccharospirillum salsuginis]
MKIVLDNLEGPEVADLLQDHLDQMAIHSPPESRHALDLDGLKSPSVTFWSAWDGDNLMGCGALKELDARHGELKSMKTANAYLKRGVAKALLRHILAEAERRGYRRVSLETGSMAAFDPARRLYANFGFTDCDPFADYVEDPNSVFMTLELPVANIISDSA